MVYLIISAVRPLGSLCFYWRHPELHAYLLHRTSVTPTHLKIGTWFRLQVIYFNINHRYYFIGHKYSANWTNLNKQNLFISHDRPRSNTIRHDRPNLSLCHGQIGQRHAAGIVLLDMVEDVETGQRGDCSHGAVYLLLQTLQTVLLLADALRCGHQLLEAGGHAPLHVCLHGGPDVLYGVKRRAVRRCPQKFHPGKLRRHILEAGVDGCVIAHYHQLIQRLVTALDRSPKPLRTVFLAERSTPAFPVRDAGLALGAYHVDVRTSCVGGLHRAPYAPTRTSLGTPEKRVHMM